jgi:predicted GNAT family N-acyltransferase
MNRTDIRIELLAWAQAQSLAQPIREEVFVREQKVPIELEWDEWDAQSIHAIAWQGPDFKKLSPVGTGRLLPTEPGGSARLGRMAVLSQWRDKGVGRMILEALLAEARRRGAQRIDIHAQLYAADFYRRAGFIQQGDVFDEAGIPHTAMYLLLTSQA